MTDHVHEQFTDVERAEIARLVGDTRTAQMLLNATFRGILFGRGYDDARAARAHIAPDASGWLVEEAAPPDPPEPPQGDAS